jgi:hypothetical protein
VSIHHSLRDLSIGSATLIAVAGMAIHNAFEFGLGFLLDPQTLIPVAIFAILAWSCSGPQPRTPILMLLVAWTLLNLVVGGILSVLPLPIFPFAPEQSLRHLAVHVVYALAEIPLVVVSVRALLASARHEAPLATGEPTR